LKATRRAQFAAKGEKVLRRQSFHDAKLLGGEPENLQHPAQMVHDIRYGFFFDPRRRHFVA
jgi:hypothetical protein